MYRASPPFTLPVFFLPPGFFFSQDDPNAFQLRLTADPALDPLPLRGEIGSDRLAP